MKINNRNLSGLLIGLLFAGSVFGQGQECATFLPDGITLSITPDEPIIAGTTFGPMLFTVNDNVRIGPYGPLLIPKYSKIKGQVVTSKQAGRFVGRAAFQVAFEQLITPNWCVFPLNAELVSAQVGRRNSRKTKHFKVKDRTIVGRGHAKRDAFFLTFPPTAPFQVLMLPARGPKMNIPEARLLIKIMEPVMIGEKVPVTTADLAGGLRPR